MSVGLVARDEGKLTALAEELEAEGIAAAFASADIRNAGALSGAIASLADRLGPVEVLEYSPLLERGAGTILFTTGGAAIKPYPARAGVGVSFAGEVAYARMLHEELAGRGIHVAHTAIAGRIAPGGDHEPADIAAALWRAHAEPAESQTKIGFD